ncbi:hypothetical protein T11_15922 [Trichinella zimbabwensis]|uniref:Uncharacterized protein n=1 Tax=Trichinella zimbabwensis TaxID=268475 RepID=A0A0V1GTE1_9BILA|nr:hypothetical protein T11_15922 [Trichinella zimbabwensis]
MNLITVEAEEYKINRFDSSNEETGTLPALSVYVTLNGVVIECKWISGHFKPSFQSIPSPRFSQPTNSNWNHSTRY